VTPRRITLREYTVDKLELQDRKLNNNITEIRDLIEEELYALQVKMTEKHNKLEEMNDK